MEEGIEDACRNRDSQRVVKKSKSKVLADIPNRRAAQPASAYNPAQVPFEQSDSCALDSHRGAGAHRNAYIRRRECRRIINAVASHRHHAPLTAQTLYDFGL